MVHRLTIDAYINVPLFLFAAIFLDWATLLPRQGYRRGVPQENPCDIRNSSTNMAAF